MFFVTSCLYSAVSFTWVREQHFIRITCFVIIIIILILMCLSNVAVCVSVLRGDIARLRRCTALTTVSWTPLAIIAVCCVHSQVSHKTLAEALGEEKLSVPPLTLYISRQLVCFTAVIWLFGVESSDNVVHR